MTLEEAQAKILELTDQVSNLEAEKETLTTQLNESKTSQTEKDNEIERLREHNNLLWKRCSTETITPPTPPTPSNDESGDDEGVKVRPLDEIIAEI